MRLMLAKTAVTTPIASRGAGSGDSPRDGARPVGAEGFTTGPRAD
nr:hypothetical protein GCM10017745_81670 [Saccharothrix mutabilis subsp. capreolus]